jgi:hypothetical protein
MCASKRKRPPCDRRIILHHAQDVSLASPRLLSNTKELVQIEGSKSAEVRTGGGDVRRAADRFEFRDCASKDTVS